MRALCLSAFGINTILTPVLTPALDTEVGHFRPNVQLVKISESNGKYSFDYALLDKFIELGKKNGVNTYEISHLYSQWGLKYTPCVYVNDELKFGWHTEGNNPEYTEFLNQFLPSLVSYLKTKGIDEKNCLFHISDEPGIDDIENYKNAYNTIRPLIGNIKILDAISNVDFYNMGLMDIPVCASDHIEPFLDGKIADLWAYYCCAQTSGVSNRFISMPSYRNRAIGLHLYKFNIKGFLHWGYNFYFSRHSLFPVNPFVTTSAEGFPSGDSFSVYPYGDDVLPSLRALVFKDALQDIQLMKMAEKIVGKDEIIAIVEKYRDCTVTFKSYPKSNAFYKKFTDELKAILKNNI